MTLTNPIRPTAKNAERILSFWFEDTKPYQWFRRDAVFDAKIRRRFGALHEAAKAGKLDAWRAHSRHSLSLIILLDQFSRNIYRDDARAFAQDRQALDVAREAIRRRFDKLYSARERAFFYMPFMHSEDMSVQDECVALFKSQLPSTMNVPYAIEHRDIVKRFGRFPHRNHILGRASAPEEIAFLKAGGFNP
ncbi:DUF924 domain-containing protein [Hyphococcus flavus]|uniref:DUF924 domain-containing protein n=1 Tax=Hyphococcus flavus TaxID=1866326 RepID=A0AAE9ZCL8_9PROT|nr:DUF924 family protein [Hyphococcus flavus]WDI32299.1 DUF924 domain-containing protein [Hyphococcus flavus]